MPVPINKVTALFLVIILQNMLVSGLQTIQEDFVILRTDFPVYSILYANSDSSILVCGQAEDYAIYTVKNMIPTLFQILSFEDTVSQIPFGKLTPDSLAIYFTNYQSIFYAERASVNDQFPTLQTIYTGQGTITNINMAPDANFIAWKESVSGVQKVFHSTVDKSNPTNIRITAQQVANDAYSIYYNSIFLTQTGLLGYVNDQKKVQVFDSSQNFVNPFELPSSAAQISIWQSEGVIKIIGADQSNVFVYDYNQRTELASSTINLGENILNFIYFRQDHCFVLSSHPTTYALSMMIGKLIEETGSFSIDWSPQLSAMQADNEKFVIKTYNVPSSGSIFFAIGMGVSKIPAQEGDTPTQPVDCSLDLASTSNSISSSQCQCLLHHSWDPLQSKCVANCKTRFAVQPKEGNPLQCQCQAKAAWEPKEKLCLLDCPSIPYSTGQRIGNEICQCLESSEWNPRTLSCDSKCQGQFSTGAIVDGACECAEGALWNPRKGICQRDCSVIDHASFQRSNPDGSCTCESGFAWIGGKCEVVSCNLIPYVDTTKEQTQEAQGICICQSSFNWDGSLAQCVLDCSQVAGSLHTAQNTNIHACGCQPDSFWSQPALQCFINCTQIDHALPELINAEECVCESDFMWSNGQCVTTCGLKVGQAASFSETDNHCDCLSGFQYYYNSPEGGACYRSCSAIANTEGYFGATPASCTCIVGLEWNDQTGVCENLCEGPYDSQTNQAAPTTCDCVEPAVFSSGIGKCMPICRNDPLSTGSFNFDTFGCYCKTNAHWDKASVECVCNTGYQENADLKKCETVSGSSFIPIAIGSAVCSGGAVFLGMFLRQKRKQKEETGESKNALEDKVEDI